MWILAILLIGVIHHGISKELKCPGYSAYLRNEVCFGNSYCQNDWKNFTWKLNNNTAKVTVELNTINGFCADDITVILEHCEVSTNETCTESSVLSKDNCNSSSKFETHSERNVMIIKKNEEKYENCSKKMNLTFNMVYKGHYRLKIMPENSSPVCSCPMYLVTNFTRENIFKHQNVNLAVHTSYDGKHMVHRVGNLNKLHASKIEMIVLLCDNVTEDCSLCSFDKTFLMALNGNGEYECKQGEKSASCRTDGENDIVCTTKYIENKKQCLWAKLDQHPCSGMGVWNKSAIHNNSRGCDMINTPVGAQNEPPIPSEEDITPAIIVLAIFSFLIFIAFCIVVYVFREKLEKLFESIVGGERHRRLSLKRPENILLVYPRDCEEFMNLMATFRRILKGIKCCKVHDMYDPDNSEVAGNFTKWLYDCLMKKNLNVILVESKCSAILQRKYFINENIIYDKSRWTDDLFRNVLDALMHRSNNKLQISVIRFSDFADVSDYLEGFIRYPRYVIPERMGLLLSSIFKKEPLCITAQQYQDLEEDMTKLREHRTRNPDYLSTLITVDS